MQKAEAASTEGVRPMPNLAGKTALVTGASRGIGSASALALAKGGAQVLIHYGRGAKEAEAVVAEISNAGGRADAVGADLAAADGPHKLARQVREIIGDRLDILVANAGISKAASIEDTTIDDFDSLFAVNVRAPYFLVQQLLPILGSGSSVILLSSLAARASVGTLSAYAATKGAIDTLVKHFAFALGERGIRVNAVAPGVVATDMSNFTKTEAGRDFTLAMQALKRLAAPDDIAGANGMLRPDRAIRPTVARYRAVQTRLGHQFDLQPVRIPHAKHLCAEAGNGTVELPPLVGEASHPRFKCSLRHGERGRLGHAGAGLARRGVRKGKEGEKAAGAARYVTIVEVVGVGRIEVDRTLDQPDAKNAGIEVEVGLCVTGNRRDVVQPADANVFRHVCLLNGVVIEIEFVCSDRAD
jgi:3-oxoacyl-[acyl-carrier protein] reductase